MSWTHRDGAPTDITALAQTADGYLWIGSGLGLYRFDGLRFAPYPFTEADPRLPSSNISALAADPQGGLWIGYRMGGITHLQGRSKVDYDKRSGLVSESTEQLLCRPDGSVWATADGRLMHWTPDGWENYSAKHGLSSEGLYTLFFDAAGTLWTAESKHVYRLEPSAQRFQEFKTIDREVNQFAQSSDGTLWVSDAWIHAKPLFDRNVKRAVRIPGVPVMLASKTSGAIWLAHDFGGLTRIAAPGSPNQTVQNFKAADGLTDGQTRALLEDQQGTVWVGTARGLDRFQRTPINTFHGVHLDYYPALIADRQSGIWLNDMDKPLMLYRNGRLTGLDGVAHGSSSLFQDSRGGVWLLDPISHTFFRYAEDGRQPQKVLAPPVARSVETWCIGEDDDGRLLASFEGHGLWRYAAPKWERVDDPVLPKESPLSIAKTGSGIIWLGYPHNQIVTHDSSGYHMIDSRLGLALNTVLAFYDAGGLTLAGGSDGLALRRSNGHFVSLQARTQNLLRGISGIVRDRQDDLWLNAAVGIVHIPSAEWRKAVRDQNHVMDVQVLNEREGLMGTPAQNKPTPSAVMERNGTLWFATSGHLISIHPEAVHWDQDMPHVSVQSVLINGRVRGLKEDGSISEAGHALKSLEFDYIGVDLGAADRVTYQYLLEGQDKDWQIAGTRGQAFYTNLAPGTYHFRVRASNGTGRWSEMQAPIHIAIQPAFYQTKWFLACCIVFFAAILWSFYLWRVSYLTAQMRERTEARVHERLRIARDLHDTLLQGIQGLVLRFHFATEQLSEAEPAREMLRSALNRADQVINEGRNKVRELRSAAEADQDLPKRILQLTETMQAESEAAIQCSIIGEPRILEQSVQDELFDITREALTNAVRHSEARNIQIELAFGRRFLKLVCADDGRGIGPGQLQRSADAGHFGILGMRERAERLGCRLHLHSTTESGTRVGAEIAAKRAYRPATKFAERRSELALPS